MICTFPFPKSVCFAFLTSLFKKKIRLYIQDEPTNHYDYNTLNSGIYQENTEKIVDNLDNFANEIVAQIDKCISTAMKISPELLSNSNGNTNEIFLARKNLLLWIEKLANFQQSRQLYGTLNSGNFQYGSGQKISLDSSHFQSASEDTSPQSSVSRHPHLMVFKFLIFINL